MAITVEAIIDSLRDGQGRVVIPPHLARREYDNLEQAVSEGVSYMEGLRQSTWQCGDVIAAAYLQTEVLLADAPATERATALAALVRHFASQYGVDPETVRRWLKVATIFPETHIGPDGPVQIRDYSVAINVYLTGLEALRYGVSRDEVLDLVSEAIGNDWNPHTLRQVIQKRYDPDGIGPITTVREWLNHELPGDMDREDVITQIADAINTAYAAAGQFNNGPLMSLAVEVRGIYERRMEVLSVAGG